MVTYLPFQYTLHFFCVNFARLYFYQTFVFYPDYEANIVVILHKYTFLNASTQNWDSGRQKIGRGKGSSIKRSLFKKQGLASKSQMKPKSLWHTVNSPKKWTNEFVLFAFLLFTANKTNLFLPFLGESTAHPNCFWFFKKWQMFVGLMHYCQGNMNYWPNDKVQR